VVFFLWDRFLRVYPFSYSAVFFFPRKVAQSLFFFLERCAFFLILDGVVSPFFFFAGAAFLLPFFPKRLCTLSSF